MKFDEYMFLKEDFDHAPESKNFGDPTPTSKKTSTDPALKASDNKTALNNIKEACEYIIHMIESCEFGEDKLDKPDSEGFATAVNAIKKFADAGDGQNFSIPNVGIKFDYNNDDEVEVHESALLEEELGNIGDEDDEFLTIKNGVDTNTIPARNLEKDQFAKSEEISKDMFDNSNNGWDNVEDDPDDFDTNWDI